MVGTLAVKVSTSRLGSKTDSYNEVKFFLHWGINKHGIMRDFPKVFPAIKSKRAKLIWESCLHYNKMISSAWYLSAHPLLHLSICVFPSLISLFFLFVPVKSHASCTLTASVSQLEPKVRFISDSHCCSILSWQVKHPFIHQKYQYTWVWQYHVLLKLCQFSNTLFICNY